MKTKRKRITKKKHMFKKKKVVLQRCKITYFTSKKGRSTEEQTTYFDEIKAEIGKLSKKLQDHVKYTY